MTSTTTSLRIHFICRGNMLRSRVAEAYLKSKISVVPCYTSSSGIEASKYRSVSASSWRQAICKDNSLTSFVSHRSLQTTQTVLEKQNYVILMSRDVYYDAMKLYNIQVPHIIIWNIKDRVTASSKIPTKQKQRALFSLIKHNVDALVQELLTS
jgi:protein-tyrosine-phosphatase